MKDFSPQNIDISPAPGQLIWILFRLGEHNSSDKLLQIWIDFINSKNVTANQEPKISIDE